MNVTAHANIGDVVANLDDVARNQVPFALAKALNKTARDFQKEERAEIEQHFTLRRKSWAKQNVKIAPGDNATKKKPEATVRLEAPGDPSRSDILGKFEEGGEKRSKTGGRVAVPVSKARIKGLQNERLKVFHFQPMGLGGRVFRGAFRSVMILNTAGAQSGVILQRYGRGRGTLRRLFLFTDSVHIEARLKYKDTSQRVARKVMVTNFEEALAYAIKTAR